MKMLSRFQKGEMQNLIKGILIGLITISLAIWIGVLLFVDDVGYATNLYTEFISIAVTVALIDFVNQWRMEKRLRQQKQDDLRWQLGSRDNATAIRAAEEIKRYGWHTGSMLVKANLSLAKLDGADLQDVNLKQASLRNANLSHTDFYRANLEDADLSGSNLSGADLSKACLCGANLSNAYLNGAILQEATFDENTTLPNGHKWTSETDITVFTASGSKNSWQPTWVMLRQENTEARNEASDTLKSVFEHYINSTRFVDYVECSPITSRYQPSLDFDMIHKSIRVRDQIERVIRLLPQPIQSENSDMVMDETDEN